MGAVVSPGVGGLLQTQLGWQANFLAMMAWGIPCLIAACIMPETIKEKTPIKLANIIKNYATIATHRTFIFCFLIVTLSYSIVAVFFIVGPFLIQVELGHTPLYYGFLSLLLGFAWLLCNFINRMIIKKNPYDKVLAGAGTPLALTYICIAMFTLLFALFAKQAANKN